LTLDRVILHTIMHHSSTSTYLPNFVKIEETFFVDGRTCVRTYARTDGRTDGRTDILFVYPCKHDVAVTCQPKTCVVCVGFRSHLIIAQKARSVLTDRGLMCMCSILHCLETVDIECIHTSQ